ncbi:UDP-N-acetylglucosamine:LPS N-acetylglucosamine transferase [Pseudonocardia eucalypti]|uniref:glycosyltransferase n=1 Tax=Pseudonocardia eucalypti TaxID=648755 RepID=UPI0016205CB2|nr:UDP-N-acetylglucosamine:LPS N-acetylglucosamine transferase [Pseudonocardia eucalypti]
MGRSAATDKSARVLVISGSVGAGHDGAADELISRLDRLGVRTERRDYLDALPWALRVVLREGYTLSVGYAPSFFEWLFVNLEHKGWVQRITLGLCHLARPRVRRWARGHELVVSTYPLASQTMGQLRVAGTLDAITVTYLTDPAVHRMWVHPEIDHHLTVTEATSRMGRLAYRTPMRPVGGLVPDRFTQRLNPDRRRALRERLGLDPDRPVALVVAGSLGIGDVPGAVREIASTGVVQVLVLCGRRERLRSDLDGLPGVVALGWRDDMPELMAASDVLIHNAGGLTLTEALTAGLPAITFRPIPGHGLANAATLAEAGLAPWPKDAAELAEVVTGQLAGRSDSSSVVRERDAADTVLALLDGDGPRDDTARRSA